jgi:nitroimidazol reductase NimA-like FMN-containing flavoprotein (pyridoxamine 5'-phosphate oxidase superfamily)
MDTGSLAISRDDTTMLIHELTPSECREVLTRTHLGRLACARDGQPYIVPVFFDFDAENDCVYSFATVGQKIEWMRTNPKVCIEAEDVRDQFHWVTIVVFGQFEELTGTAAPKSALERAQSLLQRRPAWWQPAAAHRPHASEHTTPVFYRIRIETMTGRRARRVEAPR